MIHSQLSSWKVYHKRIFLRADLNIPLSNEKITNDFRLKKILPTLDFLIKQEASIVLATHIGRPENQNPELSSKILIPWFKKKGYKISFIPDFTTISQLPITPQEILLIENLRFFPGEKDLDPFFTKQLAATAQYYVNDAFGVLHKHDSSIALLPYEFPENKRSIGFLVEKELHALHRIKNKPSHPFVAILAGGKIKDKIPLIAHLINKVDVAVIYPALCFTFLKALGQPVGKSLVDDNKLEMCKEIISQAENQHITSIFPLDYQVAYDLLDGPLDIVNASDFPDNAIGISIGPKSIEECIKSINQAGTVFFNCAMGFDNRPETQESTNQLIDALSKSSAHVVIAGGDSVDRALSRPDHSPDMYLSTGGGAALAYISDLLLPGLIPFEEEI